MKTCTIARGREGVTHSQLVDFLISAMHGFDAEAVKCHWLDVHVPNFRQNFVAAGGVRHVSRIGPLR